jgi:hypothetical protein
LYFSPEISGEFSEKILCKERALGRSRSIWHCKRASKGANMCVPARIARRLPHLQDHNTMIGLISRFTRTSQKMQLFGAKQQNDFNGFFGDFRCIQTRRFFGSTTEEIEKKPKKKLPSFVSEDWKRHQEGNEIKRDPTFIDPPKIGIQPTSMSLIPNAEKLAEELKIPIELVLTPHEEKKLVHGKWDELKLDFILVVKENSLELTHRQGKNLMWETSLTPSPII